MSSMSMAKRFLVIGGTGRTGRHIVRKLHGGGHVVRVLTRGGQALANAEIVRGDITDAGRVQVAMQQIDGVIVVVESADDDHAPNSPERVHYHGIRNVVAAADQRRPHILLVTQIYITRPDRYPEVRNVIYWRGRAEEALHTSGLPYTVVRPSWLMEKVGGQNGIRLEQGDTGEGYVAREDVAEVCVQGLLHEESRGKTFEVYNEPGTPPKDWTAAFAALHTDAHM
jgi:uncharacterized protein YbjT (DUF2867 family)